MSSEACVHFIQSSNIISARDLTLSTSQSVTIETSFPALCSSAHTNNNLSLFSGTSDPTGSFNSRHLVQPYFCYFYLYMLFLLLTFCINVSYRPIVNGCILSSMFENVRKYTI